MDSKQKIELKLGDDLFLSDSRDEGKVKEKWLGEIIYIGENYIRTDLGYGIHT